MTDEELEAALAAEEAADAREEAPTEDPEKAAEDAAAQETVEGKDADAEAENAEPDTVPHQRFHHERERRKQEQERADRLERRLEALLTTVGRKQPEAEPAQQEQDAPPNLDEDPGAYIQWQQRQIEALSQRVNQSQQASEQQRLADQLYHDSSQDMARMAQERPEAQEAFDYLSQGLRQYLADNGVTDRRQQDAEIYARQVNLAYQARQQGVRPGEYLLFLAGQYGWKPSAARAATAQPDPKAVADQIDREEATRAAARSMKDTGATVDTGAVTAEQIDKMSDKEFEALLKKFGGDLDAMEAALLA